MFLIENDYWNNLLRKISSLYYLTSYLVCDTLKSTGYESSARDYMINSIGFSKELADRLIKNSLPENLPIGLKTDKQR